MLAVRTQNGYTVFIGRKEHAAMDTKDIISGLRQKNQLTQDELAEKVFVTRQAVSRWETGDSLR